jgi:hypothetical protein
MDIKEFLQLRDALFNNLTLETALAFHKKYGPKDPLERFDVPLAAAHKARLQWIEATDNQLAESLKWLQDNDYEVTHMGAPPLTPEIRDAQRIARGMPPLRPQ